MQELVLADFAAPSFPAGWTERLHRATSTPAGLRARPGTILEYILPKVGYRRLHMEVEIEPGAHITCSDGTVAIILALRQGRARITSSGLARLASARFQPRQGSGPVRLSFHFDEDRISARIDGAEILSAIDPNRAPRGGWYEFGIWDECLLRTIRISGEESAEAHPLSTQLRDDFHLQVAVDFMDDLLPAPWTPELLDQLFAEFQRWGVHRCHWIYYGREREGWYQNAQGSGDNFKKTFASVGEIFPAAVKAAHAHGIEIYGLIKPFDMGLAVSYGESTREAKNLGKLPRIGGPIGWIANFPAQRRDLAIARKPSVSGPAKNEIFTRIDLVKQDADPAAFTVDDLRLYLSDDNTTYTLYDGPIAREELVENYPVWEHTSSGGRHTGARKESRILRLKNLDLRSKYFVIAVEGRSSSFANSFLNLIHVFGPDGEERRLTYGVSTRAVDFDLDQNVALVPREIDFRKNGIEFDYAPGTPTAIFPGHDFISTEYALDSADGILAVARGRDTGLVAALSPSFPETRDWWLAWVQECLEAGADGIELRVNNHHSPFAWGEFGFEPPVRDEFLRRHGIDLWTTDDFDHAAWRRLRGEAYTLFTRQAKELAASFGKPLGAHIGESINMEPEHGSAMNIHWDWRTWIDEGLVDSITLKDCWPRSRFAQEIFAQAAPRRIPIIFTPYANILWTMPGGELTCAQWIETARASGCGGFQFYEGASALRAQRDGILVLLYPGLREIFRANFPAAPSARTSESPSAT